MRSWTRVQHDLPSEGCLKPAVYRALKTDRNLSRFRIQHLRYSVMAVNGDIPPIVVQAPHLLLPIKSLISDV